MYFYFIDFQSVVFLREFITKKIVVWFKFISTFV